MGFRQAAKEYTDPEKMASAYLALYYGNNKIDYPINPFKMLKDEGIFFALSNFKKLEGVYIPASFDGASPTVGINANRPITRQRFTAAHELCHHFRDYDKKISCPFGKKNSVEQFADKFASAVLMPISELRAQVKKYKNVHGNVSFLSVLKIANYFGVSFEACLYRIAYKIHAIEGDTEPSALKKRITKYKPDNVRKSQHMTYTELYAGLIENNTEQLSFKPSDYSRYLFLKDRKSVV